MKHRWLVRFRRSMAVCLAGGAGLILLAYGCSSIGFDLASGGFALLALVVLLSLNGSIISSVVLCMVAIVCLNYFFIAPRFTLSVERREDAVAIATFLTTSLTITGLAAKVRRMAKQELRQTRAELARFARVAALGELTASIAHEVKQPLAGLVSSSNACLRWLSSDPPNIGRASRSAARILRDADRASEVIQRVQDLVKKAPPQKTWLDINEAIMEVALLSRSEVDRHRIMLTTQLADDIPNVWADRIQVQQVFMNLISNAIDSLRVVDGPPRHLSVRTEKYDSDGVMVSIMDSGMGIETRDSEHIFDLFYTSKPDGMGMGLAISRSIIEAHDGRLWATSNTPRGTIFCLTLPIAKEEAA